MASLLELGSFVLLEIVMFVPPRERFQNVAQTCRRMNQICSTRRAWRGQFFELESTRTLNGKSHPTHNHSASLYSPVNLNPQMVVYGGNLSHNNVIEKSKTNCGALISLPILGFKTWMRIFLLELSIRASSLKITFMSLEVMEEIT